jgi:excisionase family DNA binding protein
MENLNASSIEEYTMSNYRWDVADPNRALTIREASSYLGIPRRKVYYLIYADLVNPRIFRDKYIFLREDLDAVRRSIEKLRWP